MVANSQPGAVTAVDPEVAKVIAAGILQGPGEWCGDGTQLAELSAAIGQQVWLIAATAAGRNGSVLLDALRFLDVCTEEVTRRGELEPCGKVAVGLRVDPTEGTPYPVCPYHARARMVPLSDLVAALKPPPAAM